MITTKAYITKLPEEGSNIFQVNIPLMADNVNTEALFDALLCYNEGNYNGLEVGDCVFVDFEDDKYNIAIILGKLFTEIPKENKAYGLYNQLNVTGSAVLPENTKIGRYTPQDIFNLYQGVSNGVGGGSINPDDLKPYIKWDFKENETGEQTTDNLRMFADTLKANHVHWKAPELLINDEGEYVDEEGNLIIPESNDIEVWSENTKMLYPQYKISEDNQYPDRIMVMSGSEWEGYDTSDPHYDHTLFFLTDVPPSEI